MNKLEEIQEYIKSFISERTQVKKQIAEVEEKRVQLAYERNTKKKIDANSNEVNILGKKIAELGNQSQELQNKLDYSFGIAKAQINAAIDNLVAEGIRKIRKINEEIKDMEIKIAKFKERKARFKAQKHEFYVRFGRIPELSQNAIEENKIQEKQVQNHKLQIKSMNQQLQIVEKEIQEIATIKRKFKNGKWNEILNAGEIKIEEVDVREDKSIEAFSVETFEKIDEIYVEEFQPIEELYIEELNVEEFKVEEFEESEVQTVLAFENVETVKNNVENIVIDPIEELAKSIVEEIAKTQEIDERESQIEESLLEVLVEKEDDDILAFEDQNKQEEKNDRVIIPLFGKKAVISNIIIKFEDNELVYKAQMSDEKEIKIYPSILGEGNVLLRDKQNRRECKEILTNYAIAEYKILDKSVVNKIDPLVCELLIECADKYSYNAQRLIYDYAMSFLHGEEIESVPNIIYNLSYMEDSNLNRKEKAILNKICKNARNNNKVEIIEAFTGFKKIKFILGKIFAVNNVKVLPEAKY